MAEESKFKAFFKNAKNKIDEATFESKLKSDFNSKNKTYILYSGTGLLNASVYEVHAIEHIDEHYIDVLTSFELDDKMLIKNEETGKVYKIERIEKHIIPIVYEEENYEREVYKITLGEEAIKVSVVKVGDDYYLN